MCVIQKETNNNDEINGLRDFLNDSFGFRCGRF